MNSEKIEPCGSFASGHSRLFYCARRRISHVDIAGMYGSQPKDGGVVVAKIVVVSILIVSLMSRTNSPRAETFVRGRAYYY